MSMIAIDKVLENISEFTINDQEIIMDIVNKRIIEKKRNNIFKNYKKTMNNYKKGNVKSGSVEDLIQ